MAIPPEKRQQFEENTAKMLTYAIEDRTKVLSLAMCLPKIGAEMPMQHQNMKTYITKKYIGHGMTEVIAHKFWDVYTGEFRKIDGWSFIKPETDPELKKIYDALWINRRSYNRFCEDLSTKIEYVTDSFVSLYEKLKGVLMERGKCLNSIESEILAEAKSILSMIKVIKENEEWWLTEKGKPYQENKKQMTCDDSTIVKRTLRLIEKSVYLRYKNVVENMGERDLFYRAFEKAIENTRGANFAQKDEMYSMFNIPRR